MTSNYWQAVSQSRLDVLLLPKCILQVRRLEDTFMLKQGSWLAEVGPWLDRLRGRAKKGDPPLKARENNVYQRSQNEPFWVLT
jgi:hypothetical protein